MLRARQQAMMIPKIYNIKFTINSPEDNSAQNQQILLIGNLRMDPW